MTTKLKAITDTRSRCWHTYDRFTPADIATVAAALEQCEHDGDDQAVEILAYAIEMEGVIDDNDETTSEELAYYVIHQLRRKV